MIGQHPELAGLPETNLFARESYGGLRQIYRKRPRFSHGLLRAIAEFGLGGQTEANIETARQWLEESPQVSTADIFHDIRSWAEPRGLVEKSPVHVYKIDSLHRINRAVPDAFYLHLTRDPRGTCESIYSLRQETTERFEKTQRVRARFAGGDGSDHPRSPGQVDAELTPEAMWLNPHMAILEFLDGIPLSRQIFLRGEDFLVDPDLYLRKIAEWMGIDSGDDAIAAMQHPERSPFACFGPRNALFGNDPSFLESPELRPYTPKRSDLDRPLSWDSELTFSDEVKSCAAFFGYGA
jgi:hypothetical protein